MPGLPTVSRKQVLVFQKIDVACDKIMELVSNASGMNLANYALTEKAKHEHA